MLFQTVPKKYGFFIFFYNLKIGLELLKMCWFLNYYNSLNLLVQNKTKNNLIE